MNTPDIIRYASENAVPYHNGNHDNDTYFFGNSVVGASGFSNGTLTFVIGPDYTSPNYISAEKITVCVNGAVYTPDFQIKRLRKTGIFCGHAVCGALSVSLFDVAVPDTTLICRAFWLKNTSDEEISVEISAHVTPFEAASQTDGAAVLVIKDTNTWCFGNRETKNWTKRCCRIAFSENCAVIAEPDGSFIITTALKLKAGEDKTAGLYHNNFYDGQDAGSAQRDAAADLAESLQWWLGWTEKGFQFDIADQKTADTIESLLLSVKMQQNRDGGVIAGIRKYANSYVRDTHGCMRMFNATGHFEESKKIILNIHSRWEKAGFIPNWWSMGSDTFIGHSFNNDCSEVTAYYIFMVRDYVKYSGDISLRDFVAPSVEWAAKAQENWLLEHDMTMDFNGDETEQYCCNRDGEEYGGFVREGYGWNHKALSFPSTAAALCSLEYYYGGKTEFTQRLRDKIDTLFYNKEKNHYHWAIMPDGLPHKGQLTNYMLLPVWIGTSLNDSREKEEALLVKDFVNAETGFLPNCPQAMPGFCGHTMGLFLYAMLRLREYDAANQAMDTILNSPLLSKYGTVSEFYGPGGVPNGHNCRGFEGGILGEAMIKFAAKTREGF